MKRFVYVMILVALALALLPGAALAHTCDAPAQYPLYAGQNILVGYVYVCNEGNVMTVTYDTSSSGWPISEIHLAYGANADAIPQKNGNPIPGQFPIKESFDPWVTTASYDIDYGAAVGDDVIIAAHAVVWDPASGGGSGTILVCSDGNETYTAYNNAVLGADPGSTSVDGRTGTAQPSAEPYGEQSDAANSLWDDEVGAPFTGGDDCADWVWEDNFDNPIAGLNQAVNPIHGDRVEFTDNFVLPAADSYGGTLYATSDNAYEAYVNTTTPGAPLISGQTGSTGTYPDWWTSDLRQGNVDYTNWQSVESAPLTGLVPGANFLFFRSANEYMDDDDEFNGDPGNTPVSDINVPAQYKFVPAAHINPAGLIWKAEINYYNAPDNDETAWGGTNPFPGRNWATYITYEWQ